MPVPSFVVSEGEQVAGECDYRDVFDDINRK
jgi:hypothetical protein